MPIYEYRCASCGFQKEFLQRMSDAPLTDCPECKQPSLNKMVTAAGFQLKGGGWYVTDFKGNGSGGAKKSDAKSSDSSAADGKSDTAKSDKPKTETASSSSTSSASSTPASSSSSTS